MDKFTLEASVRASQMAPETLTCHQAFFFFFLAEKESRSMSKGGKSSSLKEKGKKARGLLVELSVFLGVPVVSIQAYLVEV